MTPFAALTLYPLWAIAVLLAITLVRMRRATGLGLLSLCSSLALWVSALVMLHVPAAAALGEHLLPAGMLLGAGFVHAGVDLLGVRARAVLIATYAFGAACAILGAIQPSLFFAPRLTAPGPLFWPGAVIGGGASAATLLWLAHAARRARGVPARRLWALGIGSLFGALGGGIAVAAQLFGAVPLVASTPFLLVALLLVTYAALWGERALARRLIGQSLVYAALTAVLSSVGLVFFFWLLPQLAPAPSIGWLVTVTFFGALPLDAIRTLVVESSARSLFRDPIGVPDLAQLVEASATRVDHAERLAELGTMVSAVAHEIRNPLGVIAAQAKLLERRGASPESVAALRQQVERAKRFLEDLLRYGRPRPLELGELSVAAAVAEALADIPAGDVSVDTSLGDIDAIEADPDAFRDVLTVLVSNALAALHGREGARVAIGARGDGDGVVVSVEDNGPGVPEAIEVRLFEPFVSGRGRDSAHPGTGLGLAIARRAVVRHGGAIWHERPAGGGARFVVRWPRQVTLGAHAQAERSG